MEKQFLKIKSFFTHINYMSAFKCLNCYNIVSLQIDEIAHQFKFCPFCGVKLIHKKSTINKKKKYLIAAYNRKYGKNREAFEWKDICYEPITYKLPKNIENIVIRCVETREYFPYDKDTPSIEEFDEILARYDNKNNKLHKPIITTLKDDLTYYKMKYDKLLIEEQDKNYEDMKETLDSKLVDYKIKIDITRKLKEA
jgi:ribosomal protein L44E